ncbi:hypothetical protein BGW36DRAFT_446821 [Talaromyces proteolyticus]|uniref:Zn(2)-C6 fungal-type domain-containing protein n=1 Tax=Talaromyces proteolyticus TaxID=1131652 RepID=A0AAD4PZZ0_9EURO|nr:uncharacterized protein BGW36DRAFT_446821 [Talaromyces proteolyticus]KAH8700294.1 hypothetical protein BGW36DRAFT_446821 [Talaromyces proteolyticus]
MVREFKQGSRPKRLAKRPKIKGCHECSRRRIDCDRGQPACQKCVSKGLECSGLGTIYRFHSGPQYKKKSNGSERTYNTDTDPRHPSSRIPNSSKCEGMNSNGISYSTTDAKQKAEVCVYASGINTNGLSNLGKCNKEPPKPFLNFNTLRPTEPAIRSLLKYFSQHIAPLAAIIDVGFNGYRDLIIPLAESDKLVQKAVALVSTNHLSMKLEGLVIPNAALYSEVFDELLFRSQNSDPSHETANLTATLLLLLSEMITGNVNFSVIYKMLRDFLFAAGDRLVLVSCQLDEFLRIQIQRFQLFVEPLLDETRGSLFVMMQTEDCLEFLRFCLTLHPEYQDQLGLLREMITLACDIYVHRAINDPPISSTSHLIKKFRQVTLDFEQRGSMIGCHVLSWPYFVAAAESVHLEDRTFFVHRLEIVCTTTGFQNIRGAIQQLQHIWECQGTTRWTSLLGGPTQVLIM